MITTFLQYRITWEQLKKLQYTLDQTITSLPAPHVLPEVVQASIGSMRDQITSIQNDLSDFERRHSAEQKPPQPKRQLHTMTPDEFRELFNQPDFAVEYCLLKINWMSTSLHEFHRVMGNYSTWDSITWLLDHNFDLAFTEARKDGKNKL